MCHEECGLAEHRPTRLPHSALLVAPRVCHKEGGLAEHRSSRLPQCDPILREASVTAAPLAGQLDEAPSNGRQEAARKLGGGRLTSAVPPARHPTPNLPADPVKRMTQRNYPPPLLSTCPLSSCRLQLVSLLPYLNAPSDPLAPALPPLIPPASSLSLRTCMSVVLSPA